MGAQQHRLTTALVLLLAAVLFSVGAQSSEAHGATSLHPVILLPGYSCGQLDARLTDEYKPPTPGCGVPKQGRRWFRLWENYTALQEDPALLPCYEDQLRLVYDRAAGDYRNLPGVETRVVSFGTTRSFVFDDPAQKNTCMERLVEALEGVGYTEGANLFGAPYDFRYAPAVPGVASRAFADFSSSLRLLVEHASVTNGNRPVILVTHSFGGLYATEFLNRSPLPWRRRYVKHLVMLCLGVGGSPLIMQVLAASTSSPSPSTTLLGSVLAFGNRSFASTLSLLPSPKVYGNTPLVITRARNYSAKDMPEFLAAVGFTDDEVQRYRTRALPVTLNFRGPLVPMTSINGVGVPTIDRLIYWDGNFSAKPQVVNSDGDGIVSLDTVLALQTFVGDDPDQRYFKSVLIPNMTHTGMISDHSALNRVVKEILEANQATHS
ncbi:lecithin-cholesterol acyltransferase-like 1 [Miscanthus floridulus]|uniref:lecithin-cholesterol acyltransferase-like 1 n=1 Tax=Miscanthus floridulus TaxID=154761 RepID=UPI003459BF65